MITFAGIDGQSKYAHNWDLNNFGPRVGFAWKATDKWVVRGGGAILYTGEYDIAAPVGSLHRLQHAGNVCIEQQRCDAGLPSEEWFPGACLLRPRRS